MKRALPLLSLWLCAFIVQAAVTEKDYLGRTVTLQQPAQRIVALAPHIVENLFSAGAGDRLVGVVEYSDYPAAARELPRVGSYRAFSLESILALEPDLLVTWASGNGMASLQDLQALGVPVFVSEPRRLADVPRSLRAYGNLAGTGAVAERAANEFEGSVALLAARYREQPAVSVFYQIWHEPLQTLNGDHLVNDAIELCGGRNSFADAPSLAPRISLESILQRNPAAIVASGADSERPPWLDEWLRYPDLRAVQNDALFFISPDHIQRPTTRLLRGARMLCAQLDSLRGG